jgi:hypothetical protein
VFIGGRSKRWSLREYLEEVLAGGRESKEKEE